VPPTRKGPSKTVDEYLAALPAPERAALSKLRAQIRVAAPKAEEVISYQIPTYRHRGPLVHFAAQAKHLSFTVVSPDVVRAFRGDLEPFEVSGRTIHFTPAQPLPAELVKRLVKARVKENEGRAKP
jgi:uncharacterized protein YdhG (YjbR/CyaY superfamily)